MATTLEIQKALKAAGFDPGAIDGIPGRNTLAAVKAFQGARGLAVDGIVGPVTLRALFGEFVGKPESPIPWYDILDGARLAGIDEHGDTQEIADWASDIGIRNFDARAIPWCGLAVAHGIATALPDEPIPTNPLGARNWLKFGRSCEPQKGAVLVFWRGSPSGWKGHVGLFHGEDSVAFHVLGGNQADRVSITRIAKNRLLGARWPLTAEFLLTGKGEASATGGLSTNEA